MKTLVVVSIAALLGGCFSTAVTQERATRASSISEDQARAIVAKFFGVKWAEQPVIKAGMSGSAGCNRGIEKTISLNYTDIQVAWSSNPLVTSGVPKPGFTHGLMLIGPNTAGFWCGTSYKEEHYFKNAEDRDLFVDAMIRLGAKVETK
jgi:hypothetical protein